MGVGGGDERSDLLPGKCLYVYTAMPLTILSNNQGSKYICGHKAKTANERAEESEMKLRQETRGRGQKR